MGTSYESHGRLVRPSYDVIFCRNLLIYLRGAAGAELMRRLADWLAPQGLLFVGHAEMWLCPAELLVPVSTPHTFALRRAEQLLLNAAAGPTTPVPQQRLAGWPFE